MHPAKSIPDRWRLARLISLVVVLVFIFECQSGFVFAKSRRMFRVTRLGRIDHIDLLSIEAPKGEIEKLKGLKVVQGREALRIAAIWRRQKFLGRSPEACHEPAYAIRFYWRNKVVLFASVCWACRNVTFIEPEYKYWVAFNSKSKDAQTLKQVFTRAFPSERRVIS